MEKQVRSEQAKTIENAEVFELSHEDEKALEDFGAQLLWEYNYAMTN